MSTRKGPTEGGSGGGRRGHSNMAHWEYTEEIKAGTRIRRRNNEKNEIRKEIDGLERNKKR